MAATTFDARSEAETLGTDLPWIAGEARRFVRRAKGDPDELVSCGAEYLLYGAFRRRAVGFAAPEARDPGAAFRAYAATALRRHWKDLERADRRRQLPRVDEARFDLIPDEGRGEGDDQKASVLEALAADPHPRMQRLCEILRMLRGGASRSQVLVAVGYGRWARVTDLVLWAKARLGLDMGRNGGKKKKSETPDLLGPDGSLSTVDPDAVKTAVTELAESDMAMVPVRNLRTGETCAGIRRFVDEEADTALLASVRGYGIMNPLLVREAGEDADSGQKLFEIIAGHRRYTAALAAGIESVPVRILSMQNIGAQVNEVLGRKRVDPEIAARFAGGVDNLAREPLSEPDLLSFLQWFVGSDKEGLRKKNGDINVAAVAKALGIGYQFARARLMVLEKFSGEEITDLCKKVADDPDTLSWSKVHHALRSGSAAALTALRGMVWPDKVVESAGSGESLATPEPEGEAQADRSSPLEVRSRARTDALLNDGVQVKFVGTPGKSKIAAEVTVRLPLGRRTFSGTAGDENFKAMMEAVANTVNVWARRGAGTRDSAEDKTVRVEVLGACDAAVHGLMQKIKVDE